MLKKFRILAPVLLLISIFLGGQAMAQSTIFNIPTTDTVTKGHAYAEFDFLPQIPGYDDDSRLYLYNPRLVVGAPGNLEFGVNFPTYNLRASGSSETYAYLQPNAKWRFYNSDEYGIAMAVGGIVNTPLNHRDGQDTWGLLYGLFSKKVKTGNYGPRFHGGIYGAVSSEDDPAWTGRTHVGAILGYEQPVYKRMSFVADWFSGKNAVGYFTPGISITLPKNGLLNAGYSIGNDSWEDSNATKNRSMFLYYGITF